MDLSSPEQGKKHLIDLMKSFDDAMLATRSDHGIHARPMAIAELTDDGTIVFVTSVDSPKIHELDADAKVYVTMQAKTRFVALTGFARTIDDPTRVARLWREPWKVWFPNGKSDPTIRLIEVTPIDAECWDLSGGEGLQYAFDAAKAYIQGKKPRVDRAQHERIRLG
jgi:general stress protein 26